MSRRFLQVFGLVALVGMFVASVGALLMVKEKFTISIAGDTAGKMAGPDPLALLRDDVEAQRRDLAALAKALDENFKTLAASASEAPPAGADARAFEAAVASLRGGLARVEAAIERQAAESRELSRVAQTETRVEIERLRARLEALTAGGVVTPPSPRTTPSEPGTASPAPSPPSVPAPSPPSTAPAAPPAATPPAPAPPAPAATAPPAPTPPAAATAPAGKRKGFLSFSLPSQGFDFDKPTKFEWVPSLSRVGFDAKSTLHDFSGAAGDVEGSFTARLSQPATAKGSAKVAVANLDTGIKERNDDMEVALEATRFATMEFAMTSFQPGQVDAKAMTVTGTAVGKLTIHGVTRDISVPLRISVDESKRVVVEGEAPFKMSDFGVHVPPKMAVLKVHDDAKIWLALRARAVGPAE
jgi:polyisoprenoid-binding protein YceI